MEAIIEYLKANPRYITVVLIVLAVIFVVCISTIFLRVLLKNTFILKKKEENKTQPKSEEKPVDEEKIETESEISAKLSGDTQHEKEHIEKPKPTSSLAGMIKQTFDVLNNPNIESDEEPENLSTSNNDDEITNYNIISTETEPSPGLWRIFNEDGSYHAELYYDDELLLLKTQSYSALSGVKSAIESIKKNVNGNNFTISVDQNGKFYFKLFSNSKRLISQGEPCDGKEKCDEAIKFVREVIDKAEIIRG